MDKANKRNLNPTPAARVAMIIWGAEYSLQKGGSMDFWDLQTKCRQRRCQLVVDVISKVDTQSPVEGDQITAVVAGDHRMEPSENRTDLSKCPSCGGPADNGHSREDPPAPYCCSKCFDH